MDLDTTTAWKRINNLSAEMMKCAKGEDWDKLSEFQSERDQIIRTFFSTKVENNTTILAQNIQAILEMDKVILELCQSQKNVASKALSGFQTSRRANNAYLDNSV